MKEEKAAAEAATATAAVFGPEAIEVKGLLFRSFSFYLDSSDADDGIAN